jgi:hypothetical protein
MAVDRPIPWLAPVTMATDSAMGSSLISKTRVSGEGIRE